MHEYSIVSVLLDRVEEEAARRGASAVTCVHVRIGELAGVDPSLLAKAWETFGAAGACKGAELDVATVAARWACPACGAAIASGAWLRCRACDEAARLVEGDEILLDRIEMEVRDV